MLVAASAADAVAEIAERFQQEHGTAVRVSRGPSNGLAQQVLQGAPADVFISASTEWATAVSEAGRAVTVRPLLENRLVLVVPVGNPATVNEPADLTDPQVHRVALAGEKVPAGRYADLALSSLGLLDPLLSSGKIARGHDVRVALAFVERGEAEAGVVYATDAANSERVEVVHEFDEELHPLIVYPAVLVEDGPAKDAGRTFFEYLASPGADVVFRRFGFRPAGEDL
ncbi:MAG: molybdate ABC transporter substrate-binding protein [Planctomycetaceae bacterium]